LGQCFWGNPFRAVLLCTALNALPLKCCPKSSDQRVLQ
jgi:hypothetical protein